ncbi:phosphatase PAP2 family protein [soil metagenome]
MDVFQTRLQRLDRLIWTVIVIVAAIVLASSLIGPFHIVWASFPKAAAACALLSAAGWFYRTIRKDPLPAAALTSTAQIAAFAAVAAPLSYIAASAGLPLWDATYAAWDRSIGFDWNGLLATMNMYPALHVIFAIAYASFFVQATVTVVALAIANHPVRLRVFILSFMLATLITIAISAVMPAQGVWGHLHLSAHDYPAITPATRDTHLAVFHGLRDGTYNSLVADGAAGIITFPSLHAALGLLFIFALWPVRYLRWVVTALNVIMIASTPVDGGHYLCDTIAGLAIALLCWSAIRRIVRADQQHHAASLSAVAGTPSIVPDIVVGGMPTIKSLDLDRPRSESRAGVTQ